MPYKFKKKIVSEERDSSNFRVKAVIEECIDPEGGASKLIRSVSYYTFYQSTNIPDN